MKGLAWETTQSGELGEEGEDDLGDDEDLGGEEGKKSETDCLGDPADTALEGFGRSHSERKRRTR
jgi:hypothetical protein